jgi:hypothetical protein
VVAGGKPTAVGATAHSIRGDCPQHHS